MNKCDELHRPMKQMAGPGRFTMHDARALVSMYVCITAPPNYYLSTHLQRKKKGNSPCGSMPDMDLFWPSQY